MTLSQLRIWLDDVGLFIQGMVLWLFLVIAIRALVCVLWVGDIVKYVWHGDNDVS